MESRTLYEGKWLSLKSIIVQGRSGMPADWEYVERQGKTNSIDCVDVIALYKTSVIATAVFRYPLDKYVLEFPSGLLEGLDPVECALKELKEETGYIAYSENVFHVSPEVHYDPWKSTESGVFVCLNVPDIEENLNPVQKLEPEEDIIVELLETDNLLNNVIELCERKKYLLDSRVYMYAKGRCSD